MQLVIHDSDMSFNAVSIIDLPMRIITIYVISRLMSVVFCRLQKMSAIVLI